MEEWIKYVNENTINLEKLMPFGIAIFVFIIVQFLLFSPIKRWFDDAHSQLYKAFREHMLFIKTSACVSILPIYLLSDHLNCPQHILDPVLSIGISMTFILILSALLFSIVDMEHALTSQNAKIDKGQFVIVRFIFYIIGWSMVLAQLWNIKYGVYALYPDDRMGIEFVPIVIAAAITILMVFLGKTTIYFEGSSASFNLETTLKYDDVDQLKKYIKRSGNVNMVYESQGIPILMWAIENNHIDIVDLLIAGRVNKKVVDKQGFTPLILAIIKGNEVLVDKLIKSRVDINKPCEHGWPPIVWANHCGQTEIENLLLEQPGIQAIDIQKYKWAKMPDRIAIIEFILRLYKMQLGIPEEAQGTFLPEDYNSQGPNFSYRIYLNYDNEEKTRIVTIGMLGDGSGSKSRCYMVIYDNILVVKIPPKPIDSFDQYIHDIQVETKIAGYLYNDIETIAPNCPTLLKKIPAYPQKTTAAPEADEKTAVFWLTRNKRYQEYFKIKNGFAFFMDISQFYFFSRFIDKIHQYIPQDNLKTEIFAQPELFRNFISFEGKYGKQPPSVYKLINDIYPEFEKKALDTIKSSAVTESISPYRLTEWFSYHILEEAVDIKLLELSPMVKDNLFDLLESIISEHQTSIEDYQKTIRAHVEKVSFAHGKNLISGFVQNHLELLYRLRQKSVAIRDLKPDNVFVVGDAQKNPLFLKQPNEFSLGLIDFETAVYLEENENKIKQPSLGGTPSYATPSHFFKNPVLSHFYDSIAHAYFMQDFYAAIAIIFRIVVGKNLFDRTSRKLVKVTKLVYAAKGEWDGMLNAFKSGGHQFWEAAKVEFQEKIISYKKPLQEVVIEIPLSAQGMLLSDLESVHSALHDRKKKYTEENFPIKDLNQKQKIIDLPLIEFKNYMLDFKNEKLNLDIENPNVFQQFLNAILTYKLGIDLVELYIKQLKKQPLKLSVYRLLSIMFVVAYYSMYQRTWGGDLFDIDKAQLSETAAGESDVTLLLDEGGEQTVIMDEDGPAQNSAEEITVISDEDIILIDEDDISFVEDEETKILDDDDYERTIVPSDDD